MSRPLTIHLVAAEESGDILGAALMRALRAARPDIAFAGVGGRRMAGEGIVSPFPIEELSIVGIGAIAGKLSLILSRIRETAHAVAAARPDALVIIDSPDFTHRVARKVRAAAPDIPILNYAPPTVWAWRPWRARAMRRYVDEALAILPFEPEAYRRLAGPPCTYVGHPLAERVAALRPNAEEARRRAAPPPLVLVLPGSRNSEISRLLAPFGAAIAQAAQTAGPFELVLPTVPHVAERVRRETAGWTIRPRIVVDQAEKDAAFRVARAALAASGTVTLELAVAQVPMVAAYRVLGWEGLLFRMLALIDTANLANLVIGEKVVPEYFQSDVRAERLAPALAGLIGDTADRQRQLAGFARLDAIMQLEAAPPSARAAQAVLRVANRNRAQAALSSPSGSC
jgi:lipid-A-disaccharide synthase